MTTPADVRTDEEAFAACLAGRPVPAGAQGLAAFTHAVRAGATAPGRPNAALAELLATGLLVPTQEPSLGTAGRPARTSRKRPHVLISTIVAKFAAAGAIAKTAAAGGVVAVALTGTATTVALTTPDESTTGMVETTTTTTTGEQTPGTEQTESSPERTSDLADAPIEAPVDPEPKPTEVTPSTIPDPAGGPETVVLGDPAETPVSDTDDALAEPEYSNHGQKVSAAARDGAANRGQMPEVAHENRDQRRTERAAPAEEPAVQPAEQAPVAEQPAPAGHGKGNGNSKNGK